MQSVQQQFILSFLGYMASRGIDAAQLCQLAGISYQDISQKEQLNISELQMEQLWKNACVMTDDALLGAHFGESMQLAALGVVGQIIQTSNQVQDALTQATKLVPLITQLLHIEITMHPTLDTFKISIVPGNDEQLLYPFTFRHMRDYLLIFTLLELDGLLLKKMQPIDVRLHYDIQYQKEYERILRHPILQNDKECSFTFNKQVLTLSLISANHAIQTYLLSQVNTLTKNIDGEKPLQSKIYNHLIRNSFLYSLSLESVAANFNMSVRSLQRKLKEEGTSFMEVVDTVKAELSIRYLQSGNYAIKEVAYMLGYNESSAFLRAFKRWTGKTPAHFRAKERS